VPSVNRLPKHLKLLTLARDLRRRKARDRAHLFVCEGVRAVEELSGSGLSIEGALTSPDLDSHPRAAALAETLRTAGIEVQPVSDREFESASDTETPQGILAIGRTPSRSIGEIPAESGKSLRLLILDAIQEPGNVGALLRTAAALEVTATLAMPGTVDLWNAKVVRSAVGSLFRHLCFASTWDELDSFRSEHGVTIWGADVRGDVLERNGRPPERLALVVGNEGQGLSDAARTRAERLVSLSIAPDVESLNVAVAAGILLYELRR
jgi:RNA methyltransferase, TrmH family